MPTIGDLLQRGIAAFKAGDSTRAFSLLTQAVRTDPNSEQGWLWLGKVCAVPEQKEYSFRRVIKINPENIEARLQLEKLLKNPEATAPVIPQLRGSAAAEISHAATPSAKSVTPFTTGNVPMVKEPKDIPPALPETASVETTSEPKSKKEKSKPSLGLPIGIAVVVTLACLAAGAVLINSGKADAWLSFLPEATATSAPLPTQTATLTRTATASITGSPTPTSPAFSPTPRMTVTYSTNYETTPCRFAEPAGIQVTCGTLTVPQDRTEARSATTRLAVVVYHSTNPAPAPEPVVFLQGGPGGEAVGLSAGAFEILVKPFLAERDFITFDQRGTGFSKPVLDCEDLITIYKQDIRGQIPASSRETIYSNAFNSCHGLLSVGGIDLNSFTTTDSADDLRDLVHTLGYQQVHLYGVSYGTRLALVTLKKYPEIVKSAILNSVVPVEVKLFNDDPLRYGSALQTLFDSCAASSLCRSAYPDLATVFWDLVARLDRDPVSVTAPLLTGGRITELVDGSDLIGVTLGLLKTSQLIASVPQSIYRIDAGDYSTFIAMQSSLPDEYEGINLGLYISVMCHEHILATTPEELQAGMDGLHDLGRYYRLPFMGDAQDMFNACEAWGSAAPGTGENAPVETELPVLIIEGRYDPATPPFYGQQVASWLQHSYYIEFPDQGHVPTLGDTSGCALRLAVEFLNDPLRTPDQTCLAGIDRVNFLRAYAGNPPVRMELSPETGFSVLKPVGWIKGTEGTYLRGSSPLDITQSAAFTTWQSVSELLFSLTSKLYGYGGFNSAPLQTSVRNINGLNWSLYTTTSYGRPVELALADSDQYGAYVVLLFCHQDEHAALYRDVYLPMIYSVSPIP